jgi:hypothetical protein
MQGLGRNRGLCLGREALSYGCCVPYGMRGCGRKGCNSLLNLIVALKEVIATARSG